MLLNVALYDARVRSYIRDSMFLYVFQLSAVDSDAGVNGQVNYRILVGDQGHFLINTR